MPNIEAAREEIQKVVSFVVTRFGSQAEVFEHLTRALSYLNEVEPAAAISDFPPDEVKLPDLPPADEEAAVDNPEVPGVVELEEEPEVPPEAPRQYRRRKG
jgi:hypothetical protein